MRTTGTPAGRCRAAIAALCIIAGAGVGGLAAAAATTPDPCSALSANQVRSWFGKDVVAKPMRGGPDERGCQWLLKDGSPGGLALTFGPAASYSPPTRRFGYRTLPGVGEKAYVVPVQGGWEAGALKGSASVWARSPNLSMTIAPSLLKTTVAKL